MMSLTHLLDTSVYSQRLRRNPVDACVKRWRALGDSSFGISIIVEAEILFGLNKKNSSRLWLEYNNYLRDKLLTLPLDRVIIEKYAALKAQLYGQGKTIGEFDMLIGATALVHKLKIATLNPRHFEVIPNLEVEDWSSTSSF